MNNFIQKIKLFYSQNYIEVYDEGELIDAKSLYPSQTWDFKVSGLEECSEEEAFLEDVHIFLLELQLEKRKLTYPQNFAKSYQLKLFELIGENALGLPFYKFPSP